MTSATHWWGGLQRRCKMIFENVPLGPKTALRGCEGIDTKYVALIAVSL